jgi:signal transduction histidine kinase
VFAAVTREASGLLGGQAMSLTRFDGDHALLVVATHRGPAPVGTTIVFEAETLPAWIRRDGRVVRVDDYSRERDAELASRFGLAAAVAAPIAVDGAVWGMLTATSDAQPLPAGTESRLQEFADLAGAAIANAENKAKLTASRSRVVATADETRRRLQRDVHDAAQQRLVHTIITLKLARDAIAAGSDATELVAEALTIAERADRDLRDVVRGILPASLTRGGLRNGLESLVVDLPIPVDLRVTAPRLPAQIETTAYFVVAEALTNVVKHANASRAAVTVAVQRDSLSIDVHDDGAGGADPEHGTGLTGLLDRIEAGEGALSITSPVGGGTTLSATLPLGGPGMPDVPAGGGADPG